MAKDPALLWYPSDYVSGTMGMTFEEKGAYMDLLMMQFNHGHLSERQITNHIGVVIWEVIKSKFDLDDKGLYFKKRIDEEKEKRMNFTKSRRNNIKGNNQYTGKGNNEGHIEGHMTSHMENININGNENIIVKILNLINTEIPEAEGANQITGPMLFDKLDQFIKTYPTFQDLSIWKQYIQKIKEADFLMGRGDEVKQPPLSVSWIVSDKNAMDVMDGKYKNRAKKLGGKANVWLV